MTPAAFACHSGFGEWKVRDREDPDMLVASANAYLGALNKLMVQRQRGKPEAMVVP